MRIGIDARFIGPQGTGLGKYCEKLLINLVKIDRQNQYFIFLKKDNWDYLKINSPNFTKALADVSWYSIAEQIRLPRIFLKYNLDLLHIPHFNVPILYPKKFVVTIHDLIHHQFSQSATIHNPLLFKIKSLAYNQVIKHAITKSQKILTPSNFVKNEIVKTFKIDPNKIIVTYEAAEEEYFNRESSTVNHQPFIIYVGNAYPHKNLPRLLDAFKILTMNHELSTMNLVLVCPRDIFFKRLNQQIQKRNLQKFVKLYGYLPTSKLADLVKKARAYVFPSLSEGFGIPGLDAMATGLPVVVSNIPVLKEVYQDAALYFDPHQPKDMANKIKEVLTESKTRSDLVEKGRKQVKKYSWLKMARQTLSVYHST